MRKLSLITALVAAISLAGCSSKNSNNESKTDDSATETSEVIVTEPPIENVEEALDKTSKDFEYRVIDDVVKINIPVQMSSTHFERGHYAMVGDLGKLGTTSIVYSYDKNSENKKLTADDVFDSQFDVHLTDLNDIMLNVTKFENQTVDETTDFNLDGNKFKITTGHFDVKQAFDTYCVEEFTMYFATCYGTINDSKNNIVNLPVMWTVFTNVDYGVKDLLDEMNKTAVLNIDDNVKSEFSASQDEDVVDTTTDTSTTTETTATETTKVS